MIRDSLQILLHTSVLLQEVLEIFNPQKGEIYIDATVNGGGHARALLRRVGPKGKVLGIDRDCELIESIRTEAGEMAYKNFFVGCGNYSDIVRLATEHECMGAQGILFDLGFSSYHIEKSGGGFSFMRDEPLDMRYDRRHGGMTAAEFLRGASEPELANILQEYGEERYAARIARAIVRGQHRRSIRSTGDLVEVLKHAVPRGYRAGRVHFATRTFQALRIAVNGELEHLREALPAAFSALRQYGRLVVISFHSLEDRIVKNQFQSFDRAGLGRVLTPKPVSPGRQEIEKNPRARSAKLRAVQLVLSNV